MATRRQHARKAAGGQAGRRRGRRSTRRTRHAEPPREPTVRVAIIGGGCAGMAAAWQLSKDAGYEVSVYERSWRLGGKGASGRAADGRILEHGLHVWLGFYDNAFRMIRECYDEVGQEMGTGRAN